MRPKARFIKSVIEAANQVKTELPWVRGHRRTLLVTSRHAESPLLRVNSA